MIDLGIVRARAREERSRFRQIHLLDDLRSWIVENYQIDVVATDGDHFLGGGRGELVPDEGCLYYDRRLESSLDELLEVIAHEYAHLLLHHDYFGDRGRDLIRGSAFLDSGSGSLARYSPRSQQEAEASAFATEFVCPAHDAFQLWLNTPTITLAQLKAVYRATESLLQVQLAEGLFGYVNPPSDVANVSSDHSLNPEQERAATSFASPVLVDAGPGTGKTRTLVRHIVHLICDKQVQPEGVLVLTFSNEAAAELRSRIGSAVGADMASKITISTFHGFGVVLLNVLGHHAGLNTDFSIIDDTRQEEIVSDLLANTECDALLNLKDPAQTATEAVRHINFLKDRMIGPEQLRTAIEDWQPTADEACELSRAKALLSVFRCYEQEKRRIGAVDFADLIRIPHDLLKNSHDLREGVRAEYPWVLVDEYQDVSRATARLLQQICGESNPPWVVGDARQAIYRFRGAEPGNVRRFDDDFPKAIKFHLSENYRSCPEVISVLNHLAGWLDNPADEGPPAPKWIPGRKVEPHGNVPISIACANNDRAERDGISDAVDAWIRGGLSPEGLAVLARRNVDVRNIAVELNARGIRAVTTGILTSEGAGGDLAAVLMEVDNKTALPRVAYSLYRDQVGPEVLNSAIGQVLASSNTDEEPCWTGSEEVRKCAHHLWELSRSLLMMMHSHDGWAVLCDFLFFDTNYLRQLVDDPGQAESSVQVDEVLSALSLAANYRFSHPHVRPRQSRLGLSERMRHLLSQAAPGLVSPRPAAGAVRVMTCHASKGLQFAAVVVAGQSLPDFPSKVQTLPPALRADANLDSEQAESLLFVGVSRAQRAVLVSYASSASGRPKSRVRRIPALLDRFKSAALVPFCEWNAAPSERETVLVPMLWGGDAPEELSTYSLDPKTCGIRTYLEEHLSARFSGRIRPLYPEFIQRVRKTLRRIVTSALERGRRLNESEAELIAGQEWPADQRRDHPHFLLYRPRLIRWARALAREFDPAVLSGATVSEEPYIWRDKSGRARGIKLQLIAEINEPHGDLVAIGLQVDSPGTLEGDVRWSDLNDYEKLPFVLLHERSGDVQPRIFVGEQGQIRTFRWSTRRPVETNQKLASEARETFNLITSSVFKASMSDWNCDRCACRAICPPWIGAIEVDESAAT